MIKLYPPIISGTLPAFYLDINSLDRSIKITVPFTMNRSVSSSQVKGFALKIKTIQNSEYLYTAYTYDKATFNLEGSSYVNFTLSTINNSEERDLILKSLKVGLFYKIQIAYIDNNDEVGNFSTVGISKYTTKPKVTIKNLTTNFNNNHIYNYIGLYDQDDGDSTEKVYSYCFNIYDENDNLIVTTGEKIHNTAMDIEPNSSYDEFNYMKDFEMYKSYKIQYLIQTNNNLQLSSPRYRISQKMTINAELKASLNATVDFNDGYISLDLIGHKNNDEKEYLTNGSFILSRSSEIDNYTNWEKLSTFKLMTEYPSRHLFKDFTAEQGKRYKYSIQQYNDSGLYSSRIISNEIFSDFEDAFLYDGNRQLKIRYNPKLGNIKTTLMESKVDTLGSKYPFFFRNSKVNYKEFTISGLLSYLGDDKFFFIDENELSLSNKIYRNATESYDVIDNSIGENISRERLFKTKVLEWLNNGEPKLFRSPYEGNFIVRLMKVTLNPENKLGRLLHTFNCTAYEIDECNYENLIKYNFTKVIQNKDLKYLNWKTVEFVNKDSQGNIIYPINQVLNHQPTNDIKIIGMRPGQMISLTFENNKTEIIVIGATGSYMLNSEIYIKEIKLLESNLTYADKVLDPYLTGSLTYSFFDVPLNEFNKISNISNISIPAKQFIGEHNNILQEIKYIKYGNEWILNPKYELLKILHIKCKKRDIEKISIKDNKYYYENTEIEYDINSANKSALMLIGDYKKISLDYNPSRCDYNFIPSKYYDLYSNLEIALDNYNPTVVINGNIINLEEIQEFECNFEELESLSCNNGAIIEISYYMKKTDFTIEDNVNYPLLYNAKQKYLQAQKKLDRYYEIIGILGEYNGSYKEQQIFLDNIKTQLKNDADEKTKGYKSRKEKLQKEYTELYRQPGKDEQLSNAYTFHCMVIEQFKNKIEQLKNTHSDVAKKELEQYQQALYVENYEYERQKQIRYNQLQKQINELNARINEIDTKIAHDFQLIKEQSIIAMASITQQANKVLIEIKEDYGIENFFKQQEDWINIKDSLIEEINKTYADFIYYLTITQQYEKGEE